MSRSRKILIVLLCVSVMPMMTVAQNRPYIDDKVFHIGFQLGVNLMEYGVRDSDLEIDGEVYHARTSGMIPGFSVGFVSDLRLCRYLNLRCTPALHFGQRTITYKKASDGQKFATDVLCLPITVPLLLKWSAEREMNHRPYLIAGGGISYDITSDKKRVIRQTPFDYFVEVGFGCDFYFTWFKLCPQLTYSIGFNNALMPIEKRPELPQHQQYYTKAISRLTNHQITLTFNFE